MFVSDTQAADARLNLTNGTTNAVHDYHCTCRKLGNLSGKDLFVPWKTSGEWTSFIGSSNPGISINSCVGEVPGIPAVNITDFSGAECSYSSNYFMFTNTANSGLVTVKIEMPPAFYSAGQSCSANYVLRSGGTIVGSGSLVSGENSINICNNYEIALNLMCNLKGTHGPYSAGLVDASENIIDSFSFSFSSASGDPCDAF